MARQFGLGKGLGALLPETESLPPVPIVRSGGEDVRDGILRLPLGKLRPNPEQPRKTFPDESLTELAESLKRHGLIQPILAQEAGDGSYLIIAGERRFRAAERAGLSEVPVIVRACSPEKRLEIALIENVQREDLNPVEEAEAYRRLMEIGDRSQEEVADAVGKNRSTVANAMRLLKLPATMVAAIRAGELSPGHARAILSIADSAGRELLFARIASEGLSVRQAEAAAQEQNRNAMTGARIKPMTKKETEPPREPELREVEERLIEALGTKVSLKGDTRKGTIAIEYYSLEDLERILDVLSGNGAG
jgi:ParB family chromosome partitioning protein